MTLGIRATYLASSYPRPPGRVSWWGGRMMGHLLVGSSRNAHHLAIFCVRGEVQPGEERWLPPHVHCFSNSWGKEGQGRERCKQGMVAFMVVLRALHLFASWHIHQLLRRDGWSCELVSSFLQAMVWISEPFYCKYSVLVVLPSPCSSPP